MKPRKLLLLFLMLYSWDVIASDPDSVNFEQKALDYFISKLDSIHFLCFEYHTFDRTKNKIYLTKESYNGRIPITQLSLRPLNTFVNFDSLLASNNYDFIFEAEKTKFQLVSRYSFINFVSRPPKNDSIGEHDLILELTNRFDFKYYYIVRIDIECKYDWNYDWIYIKMDLNGNPISYVQFSSIR